MRLVNVKRTADKCEAKLFEVSPSQFVYEITGNLFFKVFCCFTAINGFTDCKRHGKSIPQKVSRMHFPANVALTALSQNTILIDRNLYKHDS